MAPPSPLATANLLAPVVLLSPTNNAARASSRRRVSTISFRSTSPSTPQGASPSGRSRSRITLFKRQSSPAVQHLSVSRPESPARRGRLQSSVLRAGIAKLMFAEQPAADDASDASAAATSPTHHRGFSNDVYDVCSPRGTGSVADLDRLEAQGHALAAQCPTGETALHTACRGQYREAVVARLLGAPGGGALTNTPNAFGMTPLAVACAHGRVELLGALLARGADPAKPDQRGRAPLHWACAAGSLQAARAILAAATNDVHGKADAPDADGNTPAALARAAGRSELAAYVESRVRLRVAQRFVDASGRRRSNDGRGLSRRAAAASECSREVLSACRHGQLADLRVLLAAGHSASAPDPDDASKSPLHLASENGHLAVAKAILAEVSTGADVNVNARDLMSRTPLHYAVQKGHDAVTALLLGAADIDVAARDVTGRTALHDACERGHLTVRMRPLAELLVDKHADVSAADKDGRTPLHVAAQASQAAMCALLVAHGADLDARDRKGGSTALHLAAAKGDAAVTWQLLEAGADLEAADGHGRTCDQAARAASHVDLARDLRRSRAAWLARKAHILAAASPPGAGGGPAWRMSVRESLALPAAADDGHALLASPVDEHKGAPNLFEVLAAQALERPVPPKHAHSPPRERYLHRGPVVAENHIAAQIEADHVDAAAAAFQREVGRVETGAAVRVAKRLAMLHRARKRGGIVAAPSVRAFKPMRPARKTAAKGGANQKRGPSHHVRPGRIPQQQRPVGGRRLVGKEDASRGAEAVDWRADSAALEMVDAHGFVEHEQATVAALTEAAVSRSAEALADDGSFRGGSSASASASASAPASRKSSASSSYGGRGRKTRPAY